jgi:3-hydroxyisobutyrate dehydrogenase-like beta-hydroxyacid dehydrogenase
MRVGFIGLGVQGKHLALNLCRAGHDLTVYDLNLDSLAELSRAGAAVGGSAREVGAFADVTMTCVLNDAQTLDVILGPEGVLAGAARGACIAVHSTLAPSTVRLVAERAAAMGVDLVDAPVSGGEQAAIAKTMSYMVGGPDAAVARCIPLFETSGRKITRTGEAGTATAAKLVHQHIVSVNMMAAWEGMRIGLAAGLDKAVLSKLIHDGAAQSWMADHWFSLNLRPHAIQVFRKDLTLCLALADELGLPAAAAALAQQNIEEIVP